LKRTRLYIILFIALVVVGWFVWWATTRKVERHFDSTITLSYREKRPYGAYVAYQELPTLFHGAPVVLSKRTDSYLQDLDDSDRNQLMFVLSPQFYPNVYEWNRLISWVQQGNYLVVSSSLFGQEAMDELHIQLSSTNMEYYFQENATQGDDSLRLNLAGPFKDTTTYFYPGRRFDRAITNLDSSFTDILGTNDFHYADMIHIRAGKGAVMVQTAPLAFSNYFLLYKNNIHYFEAFWSVLPAHVDKIIWNEYYLYKYDENTDNFTGALGKLLADPHLGPAFLVLIILFAIYVLLGLKRRQRIIPEIPAKTNESVDFVKTIGRLYYGKADHLNLAIKMVQHFQEFTRNHYQVKLELGDEASVLRLSHRSGVPESVVRDIATHVRYVYDAPELSVEQLEELYGLLEKFYNIAS
jgi:hypothetical protein